MSINDQTRKSSSITEGRRALELFTDRYEFTRLFAEYLNEEIPPNQILFFYGDGGNGKSLLLKFLREKCCKRLMRKTWDEFKSKHAAEVANLLKQANHPIKKIHTGKEKFLLAKLLLKIWQPLKAKFITNVKDKLAEDEKFIPVPVALLDFGQKPIGEDRPQDPFAGLMMLRRSLVGHGLHFPRYSYACVLYLSKTGQLKPGLIEKVLPSEELFVLGGMASLAGRTFSLLPDLQPLVTTLLHLASITGIIASLSASTSSFLAKHWGPKYTLHKLGQRLNKNEVKELQAMEPNSELIDELPRLFAQDFNAATVQKNLPSARVVLFFDTHEAFWGQQRNLSDALFFQQDEWLRRLLKELELSSGIVVVVAGRELPRWADATKFSIQLSDLKTQRVKHLSTTDAKHYLELTEIKDPDLSQSLIEYAQVAPNQVHPFYLGLCADVVLEAKTTLTPEVFRTKTQSANKSKELINLLLRYVDEEIRDAVHALSACRAFDQNLYLKLGQELHFYATAASFRRLTRFSFVWPVEQRGQNWYQIHDLVRRLDSEVGNETTQHAHEVLEQHYRERDEMAEAIYHANRLDGQRSVEEWLKVFNTELKASNYDQCRILLEIRKELFIQSDFLLGRVLRAEGDYSSSLARYKEAEEAYLKAIAAYDKAINLTPKCVDESIEAYNNKGIALLRLGELQIKLSQHREAERSYRQAIGAYNHALGLNPDLVKAHNNMGLALSRLGELQVQLSEHQGALRSYQRAIAAYKSAIDLAPELVQTHNNKGLVLANLGESQAKLLQPQEALQSYQQAIAAYEQALKLDSKYVYAYNNKGIALQNLGKLQAQSSQHQEALQSYQQAIAAYDQALSLAPNLVQTLNNKGLLLASLGELQAQLSKHKEASESYQQAITICEQVLELTEHNFIDAHDTKGIALQGLGALQAQMSQHQEALQSYQRAIAAYKQALDRAPNLVQTRNNKGLVLKRLGELQMQLLQPQEARKSWQAAQEKFSKSLDIASNDHIRHLKEQLQENLNNSANLG